MKYAIVLPDGAADEPVEQLDGRTPLEAANTPNIDWIAANGRQGCVVTVPDGYAPGSAVATLSLFGYDPRLDFSGQAPLEAAAKNLKISPEDMIFRSNFVTITDGLMEDFTAGHMSQGEAEALLVSLNGALAPMGCAFHAGVSYRNLMVAAGMGDETLATTPPHDIPDQPVADHLPRGGGQQRVRAVMERARVVLAEHDVNHVRRDLGENPATDIWLWGQGLPHPLEPFIERFGVRGAVIAAVDLIRGIAISAGLALIDVPGATGYLDTDYAAKGRAAVTALDSFDLVVVHVEAPDEAGHLGDAGAKVEAIEQVDRHVVGPLLERLRGLDTWRILVAPDHPTLVASRVHTSVPPPFCMAGHDVRATMGHPFSESHAAASALQVELGHDLMEFFLRS